MRFYWSLTWRVAPEKAIHVAKRSIESVYSFDRHCHCCQCKFRAEGLLVFRAAATKYRAGEYGVPVGDHEGTLGTLSRPSLVSRAAHADIVLHDACWRGLDAYRRLSGKGTISIICHRMYYYRFHIITGVCGDISSRSSEMRLRRLPLTRRVASPCPAVLRRCRRALKGPASLKIWRGKSFGWYSLIN